jgi:hypothetical protein
LARPPKIKWPNDAKVALTLTVALELYSEGETPKPTQIGLVEGAKSRGAKMQPGLKDALAIGMVEYGARRGVWTLLDVLEETDSRATILVSGRVAEKYPEIVKELHKRGHEIAAHSYAQDVLQFLSWPQFGMASERENIQHCVSILKKLTNEAPAGWFSPGATPSSETFRLLTEEGFLWCGDASDDDVPYPFVHDGKRLVIIPYQNEINDYSLWLSGIPSPSVYT